MSRVTIVQVIYNNKRFIEPVFSAIFSQTFKDLEVVAVISGNDDGGKELLAEKFPLVKIIDPGYNIGFAKGHNLVFKNYDSEYFQLVNPDLIMEPDYVEKLVEVMERDEQIGAATGKLYKFKDLKFRIEDLRANKILDTTGVVINKSGRAFDRGQHELDTGQYDSLTNVQAVSAAGAMYRRNLLEAVKVPQQFNPAPLPLAPVSYEYFDEDFHSYWEDVDLSWRMMNTGFKCVFAPRAVAYHGRGAGSSKGGYRKVFSYIKFHKTLPARIRQLNYKNHILMYIKNSKWFYPQFFVREFFMLGYILFFEIGTLKILPELFRQLSLAWIKRQWIRKNFTRPRYLESA